MPTSNRAQLADRLAVLGLSFVDLAALTRQHKVTAQRWGSMRDVPTWLDPFLSMFESLSATARRRMLARARDAAKK